MAKKGTQTKSGELISSTSRYSEEEKENISEEKKELSEKEGESVKVSKKQPQRKAVQKRKTAREIFQENESLAASVIVDMMTSDGSSNSLKVDCAKEILTRLHGKIFEETEVVDLSSMLPLDLKNFCD